MQKQFKKYLTEKCAYKQKQKVLLAVSGGADSIVMAHLCHQSGIDFGMAHCHFNLRGPDADADMHFVEKLSRKWGVPFHHVFFDTQSVAEAQGISIQMAARDLRYAWFDNVCDQNGYDLLALAHHKNDVAETLINNMVRGTGISGLHGILPKSGRYIRPLLFLSRKEIEAYASANNIDYRTDLSNNDAHYTRNYIRLHVIPALEKLNPSLIETLFDTAERMRHTELIYKEKCEEVVSNILTTQKGFIHIDKSLLGRQKAAASYLYMIVKDYGFNSAQATAMTDVIGKHAGALFISGTHMLLNDRNHFIIKPLKEKANHAFGINRDTLFLEIPESHYCFEHLKITDCSMIKHPDANTALIDADTIHFPLQLRPWREGDVFIPLGMKTKKKISDFLIDNKVSRFEKDHVMVMCSGENIVWVTGMRIDNRFKITPQTKNVYKISKQDIKQRG